MEGSATGPGELEVDVAVDMFIAMGWIIDEISASPSAGVLSTTKVSNCFVFDMAAMDGAGWTLASVEHGIMGKDKDCEGACVTIAFPTSLPPTKDSLCILRAVDNVNV